MGHSLGVAALLSAILVACQIATTNCVSLPCSDSGGYQYGPAVNEYYVQDATNHSHNPHGRSAHSLHEKLRLLGVLAVKCGITHQRHENDSVILMDSSIDMPNCCGVITGFWLMVVGDSANGGCEDPSSCQIDLVIWKDVDFTPQTDGYGATVHGIVPSIPVTTDPGWTDTVTGPSPQYIPLYDNEKIPIDDVNNYYIGWNSYNIFPVDYVEDPYCNEQGVYCTDPYMYLTTEWFSPGYGFYPGDLVVGQQYRNFDIGPIWRFYALNVIAELGDAPVFDSPGTNISIISTTAAGFPVVSATATNRETLENLTYSISETPTGISCFDVNNATGEITTALSLNQCVGTRTVTVTVSDGCNSASTTYTFNIWEPTTTARTTTKAPTTTVVTTTPAPTTTTVATTTPAPTTTTVATTTQVPTTTTVATTTPAPTTTTVATTTQVPTTTTVATTTPAPTTTTVATTTQVPTTTTVATTTPAPTTTTVATTTQVPTTTSVATTTPAPTTTTVATTTPAPTTTVATTTQVPTTTVATTTQSPTTVSASTAPASTAVVNAATTAAAATMAAAAAVTTSQASVGTGTSTTTLSTTTATTATVAVQTPVPDMTDTLSGKILIGVCAAIVLAAAGTVFGVCIACSKKGAGSVNQITSTPKPNGPKPTELALAGQNDGKVKYKSAPRFDTKKTKEAKPELKQWRWI